MKHPYERHELSAIFGDMETEAYEALLADAHRGVIEDPTVILYEGKVLEGWHRAVSCTCSHIDTIDGFIAAAIYLLFVGTLFGGIFLYCKIYDVRRDLKWHRSGSYKYEHGRSEI